MLYVIHKRNSPKVKTIIAHKIQTIYQVLIKRIKIYKKIVKKH